MFGTCVSDVLQSNVLEAPSPIAGAAPSDKQRCAFDADCGTGRTCLKTSANAAGVCVKQR